MFKLHRYFIFSTFDFWFIILFMMDVIIFCSATPTFGLRHEIGYMGETVVQDTGPEHNESG